MGTPLPPLAKSKRSREDVEMKANSCKQGKNVDAFYFCIKATDLMNVLRKFISLSGKLEKLE